MQHPGFSILFQLFESRFPLFITNDHIIIVLRFEIRINHNDVIAGIFRARLLATLLKQEVITQELIDLLMSWNHNSGFNVHSKQKINGANGDRIEKIARYMSRAAISVERVEFNPEENTVTVYEKQKKTFSSKKAHYDILEFMALLAGHIPSPYETITFYYGIYSSSYRGKERKEKERAACNESPMEMKKIKGKAKASANWARLIHKIFEKELSPSSQRKTYCPDMGCIWLPESGCVRAGYS